jgi:hypothetical protein
VKTGLLPFIETKKAAASMPLAVAVALFEGLKMTQLQALTQCLVLALTAPDDQKAEQASNLAEQLAYGLTVDQVEQCKQNAIKLWESK